MRLPTGTVTMVFTDIEGSTRLLQELGAEAYVEALEDHRRLLRQAFTGRGGVEVEMQGDSFHFAFRDAGDAVAAAGEAQRLLAEHVWRTEPIRVRIGVHTGEPLVSGRLYAGLDVHRAARVMSAGHGGQVLVSETTRALLGEDFPLRDLGEHRLKDLLAPLRLYQLGDADFPPPNSLYRAILPVPATPFLGRRRELEELAALLADDTARLVTLTGPGGTGKTRLAVQAAAEAAEHFPDGIVWVALAPLRDPALLVPTIAQALEAKGDLAEHIGSKHLLLVLDNFEQLVEAAGELAGLLSGCPRLTLVATSREPLHLSAEREYPVPPLGEADAVVLFHERARATGTDIAADGEIREICHRLDLLPLAIELAAARVKALSPRGLLERLEQRLPLLTGGARDLPERQQTLRSTIAWSYELLTPEEQRLFARLAVFAGGCTLDAAENICAADLDTLHSLVDKNLVRRSDDRYWMLETIREYAAGELDRSGEATELRRRHAEYLIALAEQAEEGWRGPDQPRWLERLGAELGNVRAALAWLESSGETEGRLAIVCGMASFWYTRGAWLEGLRWVEPALAAGDGRRTRLRARALRAAASFAEPLGDLERSREWVEESLAIFRDLGDAAGMGRALCDLAVTVAMLGDADHARRLLEEATVHLLAAGDRFNLALAIGNLGDLATMEGDHERAASLLEESLALYRELGREHGVQYSLYSLASLRLQSGHGSEAVSAASESLVLSHRLGDVRFAILNLFLLATLALRRGDADSAARLLGAAERERARVSLALSGTAEGELQSETHAETRAALGVERFDTVFAEGGAMALEEAIAYAIGEAPTNRDALVVNGPEEPATAPAAPGGSPLR